MKTSKQYSSQNILIVDDEESVRFTLKMTLKRICNVDEADSARSCFDYLSGKKADLVLLDINLSDSNGLDLLKRIKEFDPSIEVIMVTAMDTYDTAIQALRSGAYDYITKPFNVEELQLLVSRVLEKKVLLDENSCLRHELTKQSVHKNIVIRDKAMVSLFKDAERVAQCDSPVLIYGESGSGKEVLARFIHEKSLRSGNPFISINCGSIPDNLLEAELFGYEKGAFTGAISTKKGKLEMAAGGTVFLDEIGAMPYSMQVKLLRVLQEMQVERLGSNQIIPLNMRIISATNVDLACAVSQGFFREDLYFRLNVVSFKLPPLRQRKDDINILIDYFIDYYSGIYSKSKIVINPIVRDYLANLQWKGNVRELKNLIESFYALYNGGTEITFSCLPVELMIKQADNENYIKPEPTLPVLPLTEAVAEFEKDYITGVFHKFAGNQSKTARALGIHRNTLMQKISQYDIART